VKLNPYHCHVGKHMLPITHGKLMLATIDLHPVGYLVLLLYRFGTNTNLGEL